MMRRTNSPRTCYCGRRSMSSSPMYVAWMCSSLGHRLVPPNFVDAATGRLSSN